MFTATYKNNAIFINDKLHLKVELKGTYVHSWIEQDRQWFIDYYTRNGMIRTEYDSREKWEQMLELISKHI